MKVTEQKQIKNSIKIYPLDFYLLNPFSLDFNSIPPLNVNARSLADVDQAADVPEVVAHSDNAVDVGINDDDDDDDCGQVSAVAVNGIANPVDDNCVGN